MLAERDYIKGLGVRSSFREKYIPLTLGTYYNHHCDTSLFGDLSTSKLRDKDKPYSIYILHKLLRNE